MAADKEGIREALLAKIEEAWPRYRENSDLVRRVELASNDVLRKHLAWAEMMRDVDPVEPKPFREPSPLMPAQQAELFRRLIATRWSPDGGYTLARDECGDWYVGPDWVPFNLLNRAESSGYHPEERRCAKILIESVGAEKLWSDIEKRYADRRTAADGIASELPTICANAKASWLSIPRLTPKDFKEQRDELARRAEQLAIELERFYLPRDPDDCELPGLLDFAELMTQEELDRFDEFIRLTTLRIVNRARRSVDAVGLDWMEYNDISEDAKALGYKSDDLHTMARSDAIEIYQLLSKDHTNYNNDFWFGGVPTLPDMMRRIAGKFREDGDRPPIKSPNLATAESSFFTRELCKYFWKSYGDVSPAIVRDIVAMFYDGGVTEGNVSQIIAKVKAAYPLPQDP